MHVTPADLRVLRQDGIVLRFAWLEGMAFVLADLPSTGSRGTRMEAPCVRPHWGFVNAGEVEFEQDGRRQVIAAGSAFHVPPGGQPHRFFASKAARIAAFEPVDPATDLSDESLAAQGLEVVGAEPIRPAVVVPAEIEPLTESGLIEARSWAMSTFVLTEARFGPGSGYTTDWCDAPHWGLVTAGRLAIEWEGDVEIIAAGDVYFCPSGPPGHRLEAADPASVVDLTATDSFSGGRLAPWRATQAATAEQPRDPTLAVAGLG